MRVNLASRKTADSLEWTKIFKENVTENSTNSATFMKQLTFIAINKIVHARNVISQDNYTIHCFANIKLPIFKGNIIDQDAQFLCSSLFNAFHAFDKKYLDKLVLCLYEGEYAEKNLIEFHVFKYDYICGEITVSHSKDSWSQTCSLEYVKGKTLQLLRSLITFIYSTTSSPIKNCTFGFRLYYNDDAPEDYQAPGYIAQNEDHILPHIKDAVNLVDVKTYHHSINTRSFTSAKNNIPSDIAPILANNMDATGTHDGGSELRFICPCNIIDASIQSQLLTCQYCKSQQHAICFGIRIEIAPKLKNHCCTQCYDYDNRKTPTDPELASLNTKEKITLCLFRHALINCLDITSINIQDFARMFKVSENLASDLMHQFFSHGIIAKNPTPQRRQKIIKEKLQQAIENNFIKADNILHQDFSQSSDFQIASSSKLNLNEKNLINVFEITKNTQKDEQKESMSEYMAAFSKNSECSPPNKIYKYANEKKGSLSLSSF